MVSPVALSVIKNTPPIVHVWVVHACSNPKINVTQFRVGQVQAQDE